MVETKRERRVWRLEMMFDKGHVRNVDERKTECAPRLSLGRHVERPVRQPDGPRDDHVDSTLADDDSAGAGQPVAGKILVSQ